MPIIRYPTRGQAPEIFALRLKAERRDGVPGLFAALQFDHAEAVTAFITAVMHSGDFSPEQKFDLLRAETRDGVPGLLLALQEPTSICTRNMGCLSVHRR